MTKWPTVGTLLRVPAKMPLKTGLLTDASAEVFNSRGFQPTTIKLCRYRALQEGCTFPNCFPQGFPQYLCRKRGVLSCSAMLKMLKNLTSSYLLGSATILGLAVLPAFGQESLPSKTAFMNRYDFHISMKTLS